MKTKKLLLMMVLTLMIAIIAACGNAEEGGTDTGTDTGGTDTEETTDEGGDDAAAGDAEGSLVLSGSSAIQPLMAAGAEEFMMENPNADIQVQAGGSGQGLSQVADGSVDIGNSDVFAEEKEEIPAEDLVDHRIAVVGMGPAAHPEVGIEDISTEDLIAVFTGEVTNWSELGGADQEITLVNRPDSSGTRATFVNYALDGAEPAEGITEDSSNTVKQIISETPGAIGYLAFSYYTDDTVLPLNLDGVEQTDDNVTSGEFPVWAYMHSYTNGEPEGLAKTFLDYMMSEDVQQVIVPELGYIPSTDMQVERDAEGNQTDL
ncbi:phosphate ABC transporter substrate-binding protein [Alkalicoccobacillus porphyridii]|uniref:Phosphate-binding protein n=1 Tax=Alkalicoccobacillus porphyridii TaxID=2597270 RepID=A0A553ZXK1_9BACI|nr:phosphate ABC transporter substrate-binding protein [Alkalicoccobacillus porphyridii]TSB46180.1 phosphate ABC transporter substrate-binding protein [Alkalicoccobacillus porphyridii]